MQRRQRPGNIVRTLCALLSSPGHLAPGKTLNEVHLLFTFLWFKEPLYNGETWWGMDGLINPEAALAQCPVVMNTLCSPTVGNFNNCLQLMNIVFMLIGER